MDIETAPSITPNAAEKTTPAEVTTEPTPEVAAETTESKTPLPNTTEATSAEVPVEPSPEVVVESEQPKVPASDTTESPAAAKPPAEPSAEIVAEKGQPKTPLLNLFGELPKILTDADHHEMWGVELSDASNIPTTIILQKFLRANNGDADKAKSQLLEALKWRKQMDPQKLLADVEHSSEKFGNLGYVTVYKSTSAPKEIITWNIYGAVKDIKGTFDNIDEFIKWRTALMELSVKELDLASATEKIPENGPDPYRMIQVHDYLNVSFLRMDPSIRAASKAAIQTFATAYPELVKEKFFVNVPLAMGWVFAALKLFLSAETIKKFHPLSYGGSLAGEIPECREQLPQVYGGKGKPLSEDGLVVKYGSVKESESK